MRTAASPIVVLYVHLSLSTRRLRSFFFFFNDTATTEIYTLSLHDALPICWGDRERSRPRHRPRSRDRASPEPSSTRETPPRRPAILHRTFRDRWAPP